jgi:hypothetical protein
MCDEQDAGAKSMMRLSERNGLQRRASVTATVYMSVPVYVRRQIDQQLGEGVSGQSA